MLLSLALSFKGIQMAKSEKNHLKKQSELTEKAVQRAKKLERTLTKLVALSEPGSVAEGFLKAIQDGLKTMREGPKAAKKTDVADAKRAPQGSTKKSVKRKAISKQRVSADIRPLEVANGQD